MSMGGDNVVHRVKGIVSKVCQQGLFLCNPGGQLDEQEGIYWFGKHCLDEVDVSDHKNGRRHQVGRLREGQEAQGNDCGVEVVAVGLGTGYQSEAEVLVLGS